MLNVNDKHYQQFTPQERVNLAISAMARNDSKEVERLWDTCPTYHYRTRDLEYKARFMAITLISTVFFEKCVYHFNIIKKADTYTLLTDDIDLKHLNDDETVAAKVEQARDLHISRLIALHRGIAAFCSQVGLNSDDFLKTIHVRDVCFDIEVYLALETEVNESDIQHAKELFLEYWHF